MAALCLSVGVQPVSATIYHVAVEDCAREPDGSFENPFCTIKEGIVAASVEGDTVLVRRGTYTGTGDDNKNLKWSGRNITVISRGGPGVTFIVVEGGGHAFELTDVSITNLSRIDGFTIRDGTHGPGGAIRLDLASPVISDCVFENNSTNRGGALSMSGDPSAQPNFKVQDCSFRGNQATGSGGGALYAADGIVTISGCNFGPFGGLDGNTTSGVGGAIYLVNSTATISSCVIKENTAVDGGGIYFTSDGPEELKIFDSTIRLNTATGELGGGIFFLGSGGATFNIDRCTIAGNSCGDTTDALGGGMYASSCTAGAPAGLFLAGTIKNSMIVDNAAEHHSANPDCTGCQARGGGLLFAACLSTDAEVRVCNCTFSGNVATGIATDNPWRRGGAIYSDLNRLVLRNTIFWDDFAGDDGDEIYVAGDLDDEFIVSYVDVDGTDGACDLGVPLNVGVFVDPDVAETCSGNILAADPLFVNPPLAYHIQDTSPCVDAGDPAGGCGVFDIDLEDRECFVVDMGADETQELCP